MGFFVFVFLIFLMFFNMFFFKFKLELYIIEWWIMHYHYKFRESDFNYVFTITNEFHT